MTFSVMTINDMNNMYQSRNFYKLDSGIQNKSIKISIIGQGYVGLPLAIAFSRHYSVVGFDLNQKIILGLKNGQSHVQDISNNEIAIAIRNEYHPTDSLDDLIDTDIFIICVPTPLSPDKQPDLSYIKSACATIGQVLKKGNFVILESTTYPGTTENIVISILEKTGLKAGEDFGVAYSPERIDPGNKLFPLEKVPKVVGGINPLCTQIGCALYQTIIDSVIPVSNPKTAEAAKMVENIFRNVNIALVNELALIFEKMDIDIWEVINAAASKPYGFMPFYPGPGVGGHCIPLDPHYLSYSAKRYGFIPRFIQTAGEINDFMRVHMVNLTEQALGKNGKKMNGSSVLLLGLAYKKNISDYRESPSISIIQELTNRGALVEVYDPFIVSIEIEGEVYNSVTSLKDAINATDCILLIVDHDIILEKISEILKKSSKKHLIVSAKNLDSKIFNDHNCITLGKSNMAFSDR